MRALLVSFLLALVPLISNATDKVDALKGVWESRLKARYVSDGGDFICVYIPAHTMEKYGHWLNKNRLENIKIENGLITATQILRSPEGNVGKVEATIRVDGNVLELEITDEKVKNRVFEFRRYE